MAYFPHTDGAFGDFRNWLSLAKERGADTSAYEEKAQKPRCASSLCGRWSRRR